MLQFPQRQPCVIQFNGHATLADTMDAMYYALDDVMPRLAPLGLIERLVPSGKSKTIEDARLVKYVRENARLHPKIKAERKISRTDIFELLLGDDQQATAIEHREFEKRYERHFVAVKPMEADAPAHLLQWQALGLRIGVCSNGSRRFVAPTHNRQL